MADGIPKVGRRLEGGSHMPRLSLVPVLFVLAAASSADAVQCTTRDDARNVGKALRRRIACAQPAFRAPLSGSCLTPPPPPACAGTIVDDALALTFGDNLPPPAPVDRHALRDQLRCQKQIGKAVGKFVGDKLKYLVRGVTRAEAEE